MINHFVRNGVVAPRHFSLYPAQRNTQSYSCKLNNKKDAVIASSMSNLAFKKGRPTIPPEVLLRASGLLSDFPGESTVMRPTSFTTWQRKISQEILDVPFHFFEKADTLLAAVKRRFSGYLPDQEHASKISKFASADNWHDQEVTNVNRVWKKDDIEAERVRGLQIPQKLQDMDRLVGGSMADADALGKHGDMWWFLGPTYRVSLLYM